MGGPRRLLSCDGRFSWPQRGVYFFMEDGEARSDSGQGPRIVRVGTHALKAQSSTTLWKRLSQHKGREKSGRGNHRGSIFRLIVGTALNADAAETCLTWGDKTAGRDVRAGETALEEHVTRIIGRMPFLWLVIDNEPGPTSMRGYIERNAIALRLLSTRHPLTGWAINAIERRFAYPGSGTRTTLMRATIRHF